MTEVALKRREDGILWPSLKVGAASGTAGAIVGAFVGTAKANRPGIWAISSAFQWTLLGSTYWATRSVLLQEYGRPRQLIRPTASSASPLSDDEDVSPSKKNYISAASGGITAALVGGLLRGRSSVLPGAIMGSLFGFGGQFAYTTLDARNTQALLGEAKPVVDEKPKPPLLHRIMSVVGARRMDDAEYKKYLEERLLKVDVEIALINDNIAELQKQESTKEVTSAATVDSPKDQPSR